MSFDNSSSCAMASSSSSLTSSSFSPSSQSAFASAFGASSSPLLTNSNTTTTPFLMSSTPAPFQSNTPSLSVSSFGPTTGALYVPTFTGTPTPTIHCACNSGLRVSGASEFGVPRVQVSSSSSTGAPPISYVYASHASIASGLGSSGSLIRGSGYSLFANQSSAVERNCFAPSPFAGKLGGTKLAPYTGTFSINDGGSIACITAMDVYRDKSLEELRWEDYQLMHKGGLNASSSDVPAFNSNTCGMPSIQSHPLPASSPFLNTFPHGSSPFQNDTMETSCPTCAGSSFPPSVSFIFQPSSHVPINLNVSNSQSFPLPQSNLSHTLAPAGQSISIGQGFNTQYQNQQNAAPDFVEVALPGILILRFTGDVLGYAQTTPSSSQQ